MRGLTELISRVSDDDRRRQAAETKQRGGDVGHKEREKCRETFWGGKESVRSVKEGKYAHRDESKTLMKCQPLESADYRWSYDR